MNPMIINSLHLVEEVPSSMPLASASCLNHQKCRLHIVSKPGAGGAGPGRPAVSVCGVVGPGNRWE